MGGFYSDDDIDRERQFIWGSMIGLTPLPVVPGVGVVDITSQDNTSWSIFGQATYSITDRLAVTAGLRYNDEEKDGSGKFLQPQPGPPGVVNPAFDANVDEDEPTGMFSVQYDWTDSIILETTDLPSTDFGNYGQILEFGLIYGRILKCARLSVPGKLLSSR